jgi:hypothetical protein
VEAVWAGNYKRDGASYGYVWAGNDGDSVCVCVREKRERERVGLSTDGTDTGIITAITDVGVIRVV